MACVAKAAEVSLTALLSTSEGRLRRAPAAASHGAGPVRRARSLPGCSAATVLSGLRAQDTAAATSQLEAGLTAQLIAAKLPADSVTSEDAGPGTDTQPTDSSASGWSVGLRACVVGGVVWALLRSVSGAQGKARE
eukprot:867349-Rhodomonas_salina.1